MNRQKLLGEEKISKLLIQFSVPAIIGMMVNTLYNIVDRMYIGNIPEVGGLALTGVGITMPIMTIIMAFGMLVGLGTSARISLKLGQHKRDEAQHHLGNAFVLILILSLLITVVGLLFMDPILSMFGASADTEIYASQYMQIIFIGTIFNMMSFGLNHSIRSDGNPKIAMLSMLIGAGINILLDPIFIFVLGLGVRGAAIATVLSQFLSAAYVLLFLEKRAEMKARLLKKAELKSCKENAKNIVSLGTAGFIMQLTNSLVTICCNNVLGVTGGDVYISVMTIVSSVRQMVETPIYAINEGTSPILSYNYGAKRPKLVRKAMVTLAVMVLVYTAVMWSVIIFVPDYLIAIFSSDKLLIKDAVPALKTYFAAFIFMDLQYIGQTVFKSLNKKKQAIFFSLLRKVFIVVPLTYLLPYVFKMGTHGVFLAEPVSNVIGGSLCFVTMLLTILPELKRMEKKNGEADRPMEYFKTR